MYTRLPAEAYKGGHSPVKARFGRLSKRRTRVQCAMHTRVYGATVLCCRSFTDQSAVKTALVTMRRCWNAVREDQLSVIICLRIPEKRPKQPTEVVKRVVLQPRVNCARNIRWKATLARDAAGRQKRRTSKDSFSVSLGPTTPYTLSAEESESFFALFCSAAFVCGAGNGSWPSSWPAC
ncbi:unnamed protein product [Rangifer tarandus platyrhynchus]|uniref:Uncharacterized protein n=1 Tax=Rangifer tarandus platyrhynchus TaxID=3082113 RepID=A0ABN8XKC8_RANTA|nr:unnamed protein product [Rangifer tarandus platyrhynchus]